MAGILRSAVSRFLSDMPGPSSDFWYTATPGRQTAAGQNVNEESALTLSSVFCATRILSEGVAGLPAKLYRRLPGGGKEAASDHPLYTLLKLAPNRDTTAFGFYESMTAWLVNWGNARAEIERNGAGEPINLWPIHPSRIPRENVMRNAAGDIFYRVKNNDGTATDIAREDMLDVVGTLSDDQLIGRGIVSLAREAIGMGLATEKYGAAYFGTGATPTAVLKHPGRLNEKAVLNLRRSWKQLYSNAKGGGEIAVLQEGVGYERVSLPPEDSQFLQTRQFNVTEIARWYNVPPHKLGDLTRATFSNIEEQGIGFVVDSLRPWLCRWEQALTLSLLGVDQRDMFIEFLVDALTRGDIAKRTAALQIQFMNGSLTQDEWREIENRNPLPQDLGSKHYRPANLIEVGEEPEVQPNGFANDAGANPVAGDTEEDDPPVAKEPEETPEGSGGKETGKDKLYKAAAGLMAEATERMLRKERHAALHAAKSPGEFLSWLDAFYADHEALCRDIAGPSCVMLASVDIAVDASAVAANHCKRSHADLLEASECQAAELPASVAACVDSWKARADATVFESQLHDGMIGATNVR